MPVLQSHIQTIARNVHGSTNIITELSLIFIYSIQTYRYNSRVQGPLYSPHVPTRINSNSRKLPHPLRWPPNSFILLLPPHFPPTRPKPGSGRLDQSTLPTSPTQRTPNQVNPRPKIESGSGRVKGNNEFEARPELASFVSVD